MDIEEERKAFEKIMKGTFGDLIDLSSRECSGFFYTDWGTQVAWVMWKASVSREGFVLVNAEQLNQWGHMANAAEQYGCCECFESRGYAHNLACEISSYFEPTVEQEQSNESN